MANEAVLLVETNEAINFTVSNTAAIEKGTVLKIIDPMSVSGGAAWNDVVVGIAAEEKIAMDGKTSIGVYDRGYFIMKASGSITAGDALRCSGNLVYSAVDINKFSIGVAMETATNTETLVVRVNPISYTLS